MELKKILRNVLIGFLCLILVILLVLHVRATVKYWD